MRMRAMLLVATGLALVGSGAARAQVPGTPAASADGPVPPPRAPVEVSTLALPLVPLGEEPTLAARITGGGGGRGLRFPAVLSAARARVLLRSLTLPGWGQATMGHVGAARVFGLAEVSVWGAFTAFRVQEALRRQSTEETARLFAGIDLRGRDEEFRRIVGSYLSSDDYNRLVVYRDAAELYYSDPAAYRAYIAAHSLGGRDAWTWTGVDMLLRYRDQRKHEHQASMRANTALAVAVANRLVSAIHAARLAARGAPAPAPHSWHLECVPADPRDPTAFKLGVRVGF